MQLIKVPACSCTTPFSNIMAIGRSGKLAYCASCCTRSRSEGPHSVDVPEEIVEVVEDLTYVADMRITELRPVVHTQFFSDMVDATIIKARSQRDDGTCEMQWAMQQFPLQNCSQELSVLRGKHIDLQKLPTATTPQMRTYLSLLARKNFVVTSIRPFGVGMAMRLEKWFDPTPDGKRLVMRVELIWSLDVLDALNKLNNALRADRSRDCVEQLTDIVALRQSVRSAVEMGFGSYQLCLTVINAVLKHASDCLQQGMRTLMPGEKDALGYVAHYAGYHARCIEQRVNELASKTLDDQGTTQLSVNRPCDLRPERQEVVEKAQPYVEVIDAAYALFLRLPAGFIHLEGTLAKMSLVHFEPRNPAAR